MRRREFIGLLGGTALLPLASQAQQTERVRRIGVLVNRAADDPEGQARLAALLLKQIAPNVRRAAVLRDATNPAGIALFGAIQASAQALGIEARPVNVLQDAGEIDHAITDFAQSPNGGLIVTPSASASTHHERILGLAAKYKIPAIYYRRHFVDRGGLISYGHDDLQ